MEISMARGDIESRVFRIKNKDGSPFTDPDEIYLTVKSNPRDKDYKFQKRLSDGGIIYVEPGKYSFTIEPEDTNSLVFGEYAFDIEIVKQPSIKKTFMGMLFINKEVTHACNEVISNG